MNIFFRLIRRIIFLCLLCAATIVGLALYYIECELPDIDALNTVQLQVPLQVFSEDGKLMATFGEKRRIPLPFDKIPKQLIDAVLATEDQRYFKHKGVDAQGLLRAAVQLILTGRKVEGGSTITMQVARSFYLTSRKTFTRKIKEILLAIKIENKLSKQKILELYLNKIFLGNRAYGVEAAAEIYYGKHLSELSLDQFAVLAGLPKAPSQLNPIANKDAALKRRDHVLYRMYEQKYIDTTNYKKAIAAPIDARYHDLKTELNAPYVAELVRNQLEQEYGDRIYTDGFHVYTTINSDRQAEANMAVRDQLIAYDKRHGFRGAKANLGKPNADQYPTWTAHLKKLPTIQGLQPAVVTALDERSATVLFADGKTDTISWAGLSWARKQINPDLLGPLPTTAREILHGGDVIYTQRVDQQLMLSQIPEAEGAFVALNPESGAILALVGGFNYQSSNFNRITSAARQPGSSFKPFIYSAAFDKGYTLATVINDAPVVIENPTDNSLWRPQNDTRKFYGPTRLRSALIESRNLVSIRLLSSVGLPYTLNYLKRFGFTPDQLPKGLSLALGTALVSPLQMAQAFAVFANGGLKVTAYVIDRIDSASDDIMYEAKPMLACTNHCPKNAKVAESVISSQNAFLVTSAMQDVIKKGTGKRALELNRHDLAGKTGTTQNQVDAWFVGFNQQIVALAWLGFDQPRSLHEYGAKAALPMWMEFMQHALQGQSEAPFNQPPGIVSIRVNNITGKRTTAKDPGAMFEYFMVPYVPDDEETTIDVSNNPPGAAGSSEENVPSLY